MSLRELRLSRLLTQGELAERLGVSVMTVHRWETGQDRPRLKRYRPLATALRVSLEAVKAAVAAA